MVLINELVSKELPKSDLSLPEKAIKTFWNLNDHVSAIWQDIRDATDVHYLTDNAIIERKDHTKNWDKRRQILKVEQNASTIATVYYQELAYRDADFFDKYRIWLEKINEEWRIDKKEIICWSCDGTGIARSSIKNEKCKECYGLGWREIQLNLYPY